MGWLRIILLLTIGQGLFADSIEERLKRLSFEERGYLRVFFQDLIYCDAFGHVLFYENKPVCITALIKKGAGSFREKLPAKGWDVWKKVDYLFPHPNFVFCEELITHKGCTVYLISVVNKRSLLKALKKHEKVFKEILGEAFSPSDFVADVEKKKQLQSLINNDEALLGILLGFGEESAKIFKQTTQDSTLSKDPKWTDHYQCIDLQSRKKCRIIPIGFVGDPESEEVKKLIDIYSTELEHLWTLYRGNDSLKLTLQKLCECD